MARFSNFLGIAASVSLALGVTACNKTPAEKQVDAQAEALDKAYEADADMTKAYAKGTSEEAQADKQADSLEAKGEAIKDQLKNEADEMHDDTTAMAKTEPSKK